MAKCFHIDWDVTEVDFTLSSDTDSFNIECRKCKVTGEFEFAHGDFRIWWADRA